MSLLIAASGSTVDRTRSEVEHQQELSGEDAVVSSSSSGNVVHERPQQ